MEGVSEALALYTSLQQIFHTGVVWNVITGRGTKRMVLASVVQFAIDHWKTLTYALLLYFVLWWPYFIVGVVLSQWPFWSKNMEEYFKRHKSLEFFMLLFTVNALYFFIHLDSFVDALLSIALEGLLSAYNQYRLYYIATISTTPKLGTSVLLQFILIEISPIKWLYTVYSLGYIEILETACLVLLVLAMLTDTNNNVTETSFKTEHQSMNIVLWLNTFHDNKEQYSNKVKILEKVFPGVMLFVFLLTNESSKPSLLSMKLGWISSMVTFVFCVGTLMVGYILLEVIGRNKRVEEVVTLAKKTIKDLRTKYNI